MRKFLMGINEATGISRGIGRLTTALGADEDAPPGTTAPAPSTALAPKSFSSYLSEIHDQAKRNDVTSSGAVTAVGAGVGVAAGLFWKRLGGHWILSGIGTASLARNAPALLRADERWLALRNLIATATAIGGGLLLGRRGRGSVFGFLVGGVVGGGAAHLIGLGRR